MGLVHSHHHHPRFPNSYRPTALRVNLDQCCPLQSIAIALLFSSPSFRRLRSQSPLFPSPSFVNAFIVITLLFPVFRKCVHHHQLVEVDRDYGMRKPGCPWSDVHSLKVVHIYWTYSAAGCGTTSQRTLATRPSQNQTSYTKNGNRRRVPDDFDRCIVLTKRV